MIDAVRAEITYRQLRDWIDSLPERKKDVPVHLCPNSYHCDVAYPLAPLVACGTVAEVLGDDTSAKTRSHLDNQHHPGMPILYFDDNPFDPGGSIGENVVTGEKLYPKSLPEVEVD